MSGLRATPDAAIFDFDGVVIDSRQAVRTAVNEALRAHGAPTQPDPVLDRFIGPPVLAAFAAVLDEPETSAAVAACADTYHERYERVYLDQTTVMPRMADLLAGLALPLVLATAKQMEFVIPLLRRLSLEGCFRGVYAPSLSQRQEDKAVTISRALGELSARTPVVVGDRSYDVGAAHANGVAAIGVTWGIGDRAELEAAGAAAIADTPGQLAELLQG